MRNMIFMWIAACLFLLASCQEADREMYPLDLEGVYFKTDSVAIKDGTLILRKDTIVYSFAYETDEVKNREVCVPIQLAGVAAGHDRTYRVEITPRGNTKEGIDYEVLAKEQIFAAGKTMDSLRVVWNKDTSMQRTVKRIDIRIVDGGDLRAGVEDRLFVSLQASDMLEKPKWWDAWEEGFGTWHPTKLREWVKIWGMDPLDDYLWMGIYFSAYPQECTAILKLKDLFEKEAFYDETTGVRLSIPANF